MSQDSLIHILTAAGTLLVGGVAWLIKDVRKLTIEQTKASVKLDYLTTNGVIARQRDLEKELTTVKERLASLESRLVGS